MKFEPSLCLLDYAPSSGRTQHRRKRSEEVTDSVFACLPWPTGSHEHIALRPVASRAMASIGTEVLVGAKASHNV